ncbi:hypothetical protein GGR44_001514 [Sphingobium fontiphilum]|uniref:Uncharacterized protein n=1 Tax=Sphingobium fontiphilum TaxID=944425 RepID=A0A7W6DJL3_9SPHN|nr:hypothetical protein [Sphingobium fontiphilum]MBB3981855.1 hypothetical protein [Sphingobium fontiphilum]
MTTTTNEAEIERIATGFCDHSLPKEEWTHAAHFSTALWLMMKRPDVNPERDMPDMIRRYNESVGGVNSDTSGYHETITQASLRAARALIATLPAGAGVAEAFAALMGSPLGDKDWPLAHWTRERLMSVEARRAWMEPDLRPLAE